MGLALLMVTAVAGLAGQTEGGDRHGFEFGALDDPGRDGWRGSVGAAVLAPEPLAAPLLMRAVPQGKGEDRGGVVEQGLQDRPPARAEPSLLGEQGAEAPGPGCAGVATFYGEAYRGGPLACSGEPYDPGDPTVAAGPVDEWPCGTRLKVCGATCIEVIVVDRCPGCLGCHVDLSPAGFAQLAPLAAGRVAVTVEVLR